MSGLALAVLLFICTIVLNAAEHAGQVTFAGVPVPGATITAIQGDKTITTVSDNEGRYRLGDIDGAWTVRVEMVGFAAATKEITAGAEPAVWELTLLSFDEISKNRELQRAIVTEATPAAATTPAAAAANRPAAAPAAANTETPPPTAPADPNLANDGFLVNGSVNNGAASPFAQSAAFGNNRRGPRSLYTGGIGAVLGSSAFDARPYSFTSTPAPQPSYTDLQILGTFGGPLQIPGLFRRGPNMFVGYQRFNDNQTSTQSALVPTALERDGDFSQSVDRLGRPVQIVNPATGLPYENNRIPTGEISSQAAALLNLYPDPNVNTGERFNYQAPILTASHTDNVQVRGTQTVKQRHTLGGTFAYSRTVADTTGLFGFTDRSRTSGLDAGFNWSYRFSQQTSMRARYQVVHSSFDATPFFANRINVSGEAGITGNDQTPNNWGPPALSFASGIASPSTAQYAANDNLMQYVSADVLRTRGRHSITVGGGFRRSHYDVISQQDPRGTFGFTGALTGHDLADFMIGLPQTSSIAFGNREKLLRWWSYELFFNDDWRVSPALTVNAGLRWEFDTPMTEARGRLANLDVAPDFTAATTVTPENPQGTTTGQVYPSSMMNADYGGIQPRLGIAWRPLAGSSLVVRAGYGIYRNNSAYQSIALLLAQQPPFSKALSVASTPENPLTLADGFSGDGGSGLSTFAVDPRFRVSFSQNWQASAQRDFPASLTMIVTYLGTRGNRLIQEFLPNTDAPGAAQTCFTCPVGFVYLTSDGTSLRNAIQVEVRRRLRAGLTSTFRYTLAKATDNAASFSGATLSGGSIAQDWRDLEAERGPSSFDQRHAFTAQVQYTTGVGVTGGALLTGTTGALVKNWTFTAAMTGGSGTPVTPVYFTSLAGTGVTGSVRASTTIADPENIPDGAYANPLAFRAPLSGEWGNAGRNSIVGPPQFGLNASISRTFLFGNRLNFDWRLDITNLLNLVTYSAINTSVESTQFGLPIRANQMRKIQSTMRLRF